MFTYQDLLEVPDDDSKRIEFARAVIAAHKRSDLYQNAMIASDYAKQKNRTISEYRKLLYTMSGEAVPDNYSANYKLCSNFFYRLVTQENQYLLGNGVSWENDETREEVGPDFDYDLQDLGYEALVGGVSFGFWNLDHLEVYSVTEFAPLYDEENGALMAGVRFWQIDETKPMRGTLFEVDGYTDYIWDVARKYGQGDPQGRVLHEKRPYISYTRTSEADGTEIYDGENYPGFPVIPLWGNKHKQSELIGVRENIDAYDLIKSGFANDLDDTSQIYWVIQNAGGMDEVDLKKFLEQMKRTKAALIDEDGAKAEAHTLDIPFQSREVFLERLRADIYEDYMALDTKNIASGAVTATQIEASYDPMNLKTNDYEYQVLKFIKQLLDLIGIEDTPSFTRTVIINTQEQIDSVVSGAEFLSEEYVTKKILELLGDGDKYDEVMEQRDIADMDAFNDDGEEYALEEEEEDTADLEDILARLTSIREGL